MEKVVIIILIKFNCEHMKVVEYSFDSAMGGVAAQITVLDQVGCQMNEIKIMVIFNQKNYSYPLHVFCHQKKIPYMCSNRYFDNRTGY